MTFNDDHKTHKLKMGKSVFPENFPILSLCSCGSLKCNLKPQRFEFQIRGDSPTKPATWNLHQLFLNFHSLIFLINFC